MMRPRLLFILLAFFLCVSLIGHAQSPAATMTSPTPGAKLSGASVTFTWADTSGATEYMLFVGTTAAIHDVFSHAVDGNTTSITVTNIPTGGANLYVSLLSMIGARWQEQDYIYTQAGTSSPATIVSPAPGSQLNSPSATFVWSTGSGVTQYMINVGTTAGGSDLYTSTLTSPATAVTVNNIPSTATTVYVTLFSMINGNWVEQDFTFTPATVSSLLYPPDRDFIVAHLSPTETGLTHPSVIDRSVVRDRCSPALRYSGS